jgi:Ferritin-like domain
VSAASDAAPLPAHSATAHTSPCDGSSTGSTTFPRTLGGTPCSIEYTVSYVYHALFAYFDRDNVGLPGMAAFFKAGSEEEREHAEQLMEYQNLRGGRVRLSSMLQPETEFGHAEKVRGILWRRHTGANMPHAQTGGGQQFVSC